VAEQRERKNKGSIAGLKYRSRVRRGLGPLFVCVCVGGTCVVG